MTSLAASANTTPSLAPSDRLESEILLSFSKPPQPYVSPTLAAYRIRKPFHHKKGARPAHPKPAASSPEPECCYPPHCTAYALPYRASID